MKNEIVKIEKLVFGGQGLGHLKDGRAVFVWNGLPGEKVLAQITKSKKTYCEALATEIIVASKYRRQAKDEAYLSTSPWQILDFKEENNFKRQILGEVYASAKIDYSDSIELKTDGLEWQYRNKMEYGFWADDYGLHLALFRRGSKGKITMQGSAIAQKEINEVALKIVEILAVNKIRGSQLKTVVLRSNKKGQVIVGLFVKDEAFPEIKELGTVCRGINVFYSSPKSPASIVSKRLYSFGEPTIREKILGRSFEFGVNTFFQVNVGVFELALEDIKGVVAKEKSIIDMYSGVGAIGLSVGADVFVDIEPENISFAKLNSSGSGVKAKPPKIISASAESALEYIRPESCLVVDPPRAGLHKKVVEQIISQKPKKIVYLSCNPSTQARDLQLLSVEYRISLITGYNFFPKTPHIEALAVLELKKPKENAI
jgi:23S rRNA (uracil1939-C5)-methyltransferase